MPATSLRPMRWPLSLAAAALASLALALPAVAQETTPETGGAAAPAPTETLPAEPPLPGDPAGAATTPGAAPPTATAPTTTETTTSTTSTAPTTTSTTASGAAAGGDDGDGDGPSPLLVGGIVLAALSLLVALAWAIARLLAWEPGWVPVARHALGEAGYRTGATWAEFRDWLRQRR